MKTTQAVSTPQKATVHFLSYISRRASREMKMVFAKYGDVDMKAVQNKFKAVQEAKTDEEKFDAFRKITEREQEASGAIQEVMTLRMLDKIVLENGMVLDDEQTKEFFEMISEEDFALIGETAGKLVSAVKEESEKKTKE